MTTSVLDSFVLEMGIDASKFTSGQRETLESFKHAQEESKRVGGEIETQGKKINEFLSGMKRAALGIAAVFLGGMGIKEFTSFLTNLDAATGRVAKTMDISAQELSAWQGAAQQLGGSAEGITGTLQGLSSEMNKFVLTGQTSLLGVLTPLGVSLYNANGQLKTSTELFQDISNAVQGMDPARARAMLTMLGYDQGAVNVAVSGQKALAEALDKARKSTPSDDDVRRAHEYQKELALLDRSATGLGRTLFNLAAPGLIALFDKITDLLQKWNMTKEEAAKASEENRGKMGAILGSPEEFAIPRALRHLYMRTMLGGEEFARLQANPAEFNKKYNEMFGSAPAAAAAQKPGARALLDAIAASEGGQYDVMYGGKKFSDLSKHPNEGQVIRSGPNVGRTTTAAGRYQMTHKTWEEARAALNLTDFGPASQDAAAWWVAQRDYKARTGRDLSADIESNDPRSRAGIASALAPTWTSLPGGIEQRRTQQQFWTAPPTAAPAPTPLIPSPPLAPAPDITSQPLPPIGAPAAAAVQHSSSIDNSRSESTTKTSSIEIGDIHINAPGVRDAAGVASEIDAALRRQTSIGSWNTGLT